LITKQLEDKRFSGGINLIIITSVPFVCIGDFFPQKKFSALNSEELALNKKWATLSCAV
jgi:hypothetical protein